MDLQTNLSIIIPNYRERRLMEVYAQIRRLFPNAQIVLCDDLEGRGKGWAIRQGLAQAKGDLICFLNGDMDIEAKEISKLLERIDWCDVVIGRRVYRAPAFRKVLNFGYRVLIMLLFGLGKDIQSGLKLYHRYVLDRWETDGFAFDVEILAKAHRKGYSIEEVPIGCKIKEGKSIKDVWITFVETFRIWRRL